MMQSGIPPYEYAITSGEFRVPDPLTSFTGVGFSGILLEQAQFVITAEERRFNQSGPGTFAGEFFLYVNDNIAPSGPYEPKADGSTLANLVWPGSMIFIDPILETRRALESMFASFAPDTDYINASEHKESWLRAAYPDSPSGYWPDGGEYLHREPSEIGVIPLAYDVLGSSGILYDIDVGEVMFNPYPYIAGFAYGTAHGDVPNGALDDFGIMTEPVFPAFQRTDGTIISLNGREPEPPIINTDLTSYNVDHIASGYIRLWGYMLHEKTTYTLGKGLQFDGQSDFTFIVNGARSTLDAGNLVTSVAFLDPTPQTSGLYRMAAINRFAAFPNTTVESGIVSQWPKLETNYSVSTTPNQAIGISNIGYHVFDDCIFITDQGTDNTNATRASGLAILSPWTGHRMWCRFADMSNGLSTGTKNWSHFTGLERTAPNVIYRIFASPVTSLTATSGRIAFQQYNDDLDYLLETLTTATVTAQNNEVPFGGSISNFSDMFYDGTYYWVFNLNTAGFDVWKFNNSFDFVEKYIFNSPSGVSETRGAHVNGKNRIYYGFVGTTFSLATSGIWDYECTDSSNPAGGVPGTCTLGTNKMINAAPVLGLQTEGYVLDLFEVTDSTHVIPGVYALTLFRLGGYDLYLMRLEETATTWEVVSHTLLMSNMPFTSFRPEGLHMDY